MLTTCPECRTTFRIGQSHLAMRQGMVRCGSCAAVFNAYDTLVPEFEAPPGEAAVPAEDIGHASAQAWATEDGDRDEVDLSSSLMAEMRPVARAESGWEGSVYAPEPPADAPSPWQGPGSGAAEGARQDGLSDEPSIWREDSETWSEDVVTLGEASQPQTASTSATAESTDEILLSDLPTRRKPAAAGAVWPRLGYGVLSLGLALLFLGQLVYFLRGEVVSRQPEWRPWLEQACQALGCRIPLARDLKLLRIESSSLETDPEQPAHARLRISLVNRSNAEQAWPHLVLKLTDAKNAPLAQKAFAPADYLPKGGKPAYGVRPMDEQEFTIDLDLAAVEAAGYEVKLHYP